MLAVFERDITDMYFQKSYHYLLHRKIWNLAENQLDIITLQVYMLSNNERTCENSYAIAAYFINKTKFTSDVKSDVLVF